MSGVWAAEPSARLKWDAKFVRMEIPETVLTDQVFLAKVIMRNTGSVAWEGQNQAILHSQNPEDNTTWGTHFVYMRQGNSAKPEEEFTFVSYLKAPSTPGKHAFKWRLARRTPDGKTEYFGESTAPRVIKVEQRPALTPPAPPEQDPSEKRLLTIDDFEYAGSFKVPERVGEGGAGFSESGLALRKMKDGTKRLFLNFTHPRQALFEVEIPGLVKFENGDHGPLRVAQVKKIWGTLRIKIPRTGDIEEVAPNGGFCWEEGKRTLYWSYYHGYRTGDPVPVLAASRLDDGAITHLGFWFIPKPMAGHYKSYWGGVTKLPKEFADQYTGGHTLALGFGGYYSICAPCSRGPALAAVAEPDPASPTVDMVELLAYADPAAAPRDGDYFYGQAPGGIWHHVPDGPSQGYWTMNDWCRSGVFIDLPDKQGYVAFVKLATGRTGYDYGGIYSAGAAHWWYFYHPKNLGQTAKGTKKVGTVMPHSMAKVSYPISPVGTPQPDAAVTGSCFDQEEKLLYLYAPGCFPLGRERHPCVHVYRVR
ncbi:MAG: NBR1-Ig-like domain-containing protein [Planctomycetota bacterium]|nr:NBR1-Ig-like domain-containing protein [Planctomycetota bacterium]